ncbi:MAG: hypothetical protein ACJ79B_10895 [Gemmatimonadaceae bacterium]
MNFSRMLVVTIVLTLAACETKRSDDSHTGSADRESAARDEVAPTTGCGEKTLTGNGAGALRIGLSADSVKALCHVVRDTTFRGLEGMMERRVVVALDADTVEAEVVDNRVWRLDIAARGLRTADSLGVGSTLQELLRLDQPQGLVGEGVLVVVSRQHCGLSFMLAGGLPQSAVRNWNKAALSRLDPATRVARVLAYGCSPGPSRPNVRGDSAA